MPVPSLKSCCQMCILHYVIGGDNYGNNRVFLNVQQSLLLQLDDGSWGVESLAILDRAVKYLGYFLTPRVILALLPSTTKVLSLKECPALDEECLDAALERCQNLQTLDITENPLVSLSKVDLFDSSSTHSYSNLSCAILEDCPQATDTHIQSLLRNAPCLQHLNIARCGITDRVFLLDEERQLAKEACLEVDKRFMKGHHLTYSCHLQHVDVSRCSDFTSTGVRHLCTLCGPTLRSVNLAWTKVECTAFLYLSGMGCPSAVKFFMSNGMNEDTVKPLLDQLNQFDSICSDIANKFAKNDSPRVKSDEKSSTGQDCHCDSEGDRHDGGDGGVGDVTVMISHGSHPGMPVNVELDTESILSNSTIKEGAPQFEIVCLDGILRSSQTLQEKRKHCIAKITSPTVDCGGLKMDADRDCCAKAMDHSSGNEDSSEISNSTHSVDSSCKPVCQTNELGYSSSCDVLLSQDQRDEANKQNLETFSSPSNQLDKSNPVEHLSIFETCSSPSRDVPNNSVPLELVDLEGTEKEVIESKSNDMKTFFTPNITSVSFNAIVFRDEMLGLRCFQKFLTSNPSLQSLSIFSGISGGNCLDDSALDLIGTYARRLESLSVQGSDKLTNEGVTELARRCRNLSFLDLTGVSFVGDEGITPLVDSMPLQHLKLAETLITGRFMNHLASLPLITTLKEIDLSWCEEMESNAALNNAISACPCLERLMLRECCVSTQTLLCLSQRSQHITELSLASNMSVIQDEGIILLTEHLPMLTNVDLGWNSYLTNPSIVALLSNCPRLEKANLEGLKLITSLPFLPIVSVPEELSVYLDRRREDFCQNCSDETGEEGKSKSLQLSELPCFPQRSLVYCTDLQYVNLTYSDFVEDTRLQQIVTIAHGGLQVLDYYGNRVEPSSHSLERFLTDFMDDRGQRE